ncbi:peptidase inhibitor I9 [Herbihabitans rhizosphaerae]|uniref:Peptidase inhibitor I9 n=1 Tax=Herbihabitans rhizosphaerae TaxID=1872711 RepID=A0A4Q7KFG1_9PSEU|nr:S8 family peptidase [Herbihabitans rhizosphaerae]RZS30401.1 peptidase inhibitor I9 [Herbihabitans rhizosphaerae]
MTTSRKSRGRLLVGLGLAGAVATATAIAALPAQADQVGEIRSANAQGTIPGSYIVVLKDDGLRSVSEVTSKAQGLASKFGGQVKNTYGAALKGFSVNISEGQAKKLAADSSVKYVTQNKAYKVSDEQPDPPSWGLDRVDQKDLPLDKKYTYDTKADNVTAYIIDTGIRASHKTFEGRVGPGFDAVDGDDDPADGHGHGTHVAGTVGGAEYGLAKGVKLSGVRVLDDQGSGSTDGVVKGIDWVAQNAKAPSVANMSLGGPADQALDDAVKGAVAKGITFAVAAGNSSDDASGYSPARVEEALTVAASDDKDAQAEFSSFGSVVDIYAPGVDITSAGNTDDTGTDTMSGTSMASPHVAGAAALYLAANPDAKPDAVAKALTDAATPDKITNPGEGTPNKLLYTGK